jgi:GTP cyclohydrolase I
MATRRKSAKTPAPSTPAPHKRDKRRDNQAIDNLKLLRTPAEIERAQAHVRGLLRYVGEDPEREGLLDTPARVVRAFDEHFSGYALDPGEYLAKTFEEVEGYDELVLVSDIEVFSHCEHHMVPFVGKAHVAYIPNGRVVGLSKIARVVDVYAKRLQVQEKLTKQIADAIQGHLAPQGVAVIMQCQHFCMCYRGVKKPGSWTTTSKLHGLFLIDAAARMELFTLIGMKRQLGSAG